MSISSNVLICASVSVDFLGFILGKPPISDGYFLPLRYISTAYKTIYLIGTLDFSFSLVSKL